MNSSSHPDRMPEPPPSSAPVSLLPSPFTLDDQLQIFRSLPAPTVITTFDKGIILEASDAWFREMGYTRDEVIGVSALDVGFYLRAEQRDSFLQLLKAEGEVRNAIVEYRLKSHQIVSFLRSSTLIELAGETCIITTLQNITETERLERLLRETSVRYEALYENSRDAVGIVKNDTIEYVNPATVALFGYDRPDELLGRPVYDLFAPDRRREAQERNAEQFARNQAQLFYETRGLRKDGSEFDAEAKSTLFELDGERFVLAIIRDITEQRRAAFELAERMKELRCLSRVRSVLIAEQSMEQLCQGLIREVCLGMAYPDIAVAAITLDAQVYVSESASPPAAATLATPIAAHGVWRGSIEVRYTEERPFLLPFEQDLIDAIAADVGLWLERHEAELALRESVEQYRSLFDNTVNGIMVCELIFDETGAPCDHRFVHGNAAFERLTGVTVSAEVGKTSREMSIGWPPETLKRLYQIALTGEVIEYERFNESLGRHYETRVFSPRRGQFVHVFSDITQRKQAELALRDHARELERRVTERTASLNQANAELAYANRAKDEFLATMSHELRTPLNGILGMSESLLEGMGGSLSEKQQRSLHMIEVAGRHLLGLINDILDVSKIEAGKMEIWPEVVDVHELCQASLQFVRQLALKKRVTVTYAGDQRVTRLEADPKRLKQILVNLLTNAVKFTPADGTVCLEVHADRVADRVMLSVSDTGIGIGPEDLQRLFQPFVQVDSSLARGQEGSGLGLVLVQRFTELHGGSVRVESTVGKGSRFTVVLPWPSQEGASSAPTDRTETGPPESHDAPSSARRVVLLTEDNATNATMVTSYLEEHGYQVVGAQNGAEALAILETVAVDVVLMDIQMPVVDGLEATRRLRADPRFATLPIIALTALAMPGDRERCLAAGANVYLSKPVSLHLLEEQIRIWTVTPKTPWAHSVST